MMPPVLFTASRMVVSFGRGVRRGRWGGRGFGHDGGGAVDGDMPANAWRWTFRDETLESIAQWSRGCSGCDTGGALRRRDPAGGSLSERHEGSNVRPVIASGIAAMVDSAATVGSRTSFKTLGPRGPIEQHGIYRDAAR